MKWLRQLFQPLPDPRLAELEAENRALKNRLEYLVRTIRDMDQEIYNMSQRNNWAGMRPHFNKLLDEVTTRKVAESKRISELLLPELTNTYSEEPKRIGNAKV